MAQDTSSMDRTWRWTHYVTNQCALETISMNTLLLRVTERLGACPNCNYEIFMLVLKHNHKSCSSCVHYFALLFSVPLCQPVQHVLPLLSVSYTLVTTFTLLFCLIRWPKNEDFSYLEVLGCWVSHLWNTQHSSERPHFWPPVLVLLVECPCLTSLQSHGQCFTHTS